MKATDLASLTLDLLEKAVLGSICNQKLKPLNTFPGVDIIRCTNLASAVNITRGLIPRDNIRVETVMGGTRVKDKTTDNPEYICVFGLRQNDVRSSLITDNHLFFKETFVQRPTQEMSVFSRALVEIKQAKPTLFSRHVAFILRVSKSTRTLITYNMHPQIWAK